LHSPRAAGWLAYDKVKHLVDVALHAAAGTGEFAARLYKRLIASGKKTNGAIAARLAKDRSHPECQD